MFKDKVNKLLQDCLEERTDLFLIDFDVQDNYTIKVIIDGDNGVLVEDCIYVSRAIEHNLDREEQDFSLEVASAGVSRPLQMPRQYVKNIGRKLAVKTTQEEVIEAEITAANEQQITLEWTTREQKKESRKV